MPDARPGITVFCPDPVIFIAPGVRVRVQVPEAGRPLSVTLPVAKLHVGDIMVPGIGAPGIGGCAFITRLTEGTETHPETVDTVKLCVPTASPEMVLLVPVPVVINPSGLVVMVHVPGDGSPVRRTLPVDTVHVGCVIVPITGAVGGKQRIEMR